MTINMNRANEMVKNSGYKKGFIAESIGMTPNRLVQTLLGNRKFAAEEYVAFCKFFNVAPQDLID